MPVLEWASAKGSRPLVGSSALLSRFGITFTECCVLVREASDFARLCSGNCFGFEKRTWLTKDRISITIGTQRVIQCLPNYEDANQDLDLCKTDYEPNNDTVRPERTVVGTLQLEPRGIGILGGELHGT